MTSSAVEIERVRTRFNTVRVVRRGVWTDLDVEGATFASYHPRRLLTGYSWDALCAGVLCHPAPGRVLLLGLGGGTCLRPLYALAPHVAVTGIEIDGDIVRLSRAHLALDALPVDVQVADAREVLATSRRRYDVIVDDLFLSGPADVFRAGFVEAGELRRLQRRLRPGGILVANVITDTEHAPARAAARRAFLEAFPRVRIITPARGYNEILVGGPRLRPVAEVRGEGARFGAAADRKAWDALGFRRLRT